jgi:hypothetical protein
MDILPCTHKDRNSKSTAIRLTNKQDNGTYDKKYSDPDAYHDWFLSRMTIKSMENRNILEAKADTKIDEVPTYKRRTTLQKAIQLLKRHRDIMFSDNNDDAPISVIITTLAALAYNGEQNLYEALKLITKKIPSYVVDNGEGYIIKNPVMEEENFADKWNEDDKKAQAFYKWVAAVRSDLLENPLKLAGIDAIGESLMLTLGEAPVKRALNKCGQDMKSSRDNGTLYVNRTTGGLSAAAAVGISVKGHTFFGK